MEQSGARRARAVTLGVVALVALAAALWALAGGSRAAPRLPARPLAVLAAERRIVVEVRNGTTRAGLARQVTRLLREQGVDVIYFGTASKSADSTRILVRRGDLSRGREIARLLGAGGVSAAPDSLLRVDVTVLLGADFRLPKDRLPL